MAPVTVTEIPPSMVGKGRDVAWAAPEARLLPYKDASELGATALLVEAADCTVRDVMTP